MNHIMSDYPNVASESLPLFDFGATAKATRADAHRQAEPKQADRRRLALQLLADAGNHGLTRHELADAMALPLQSVCSVALAILRDGLASEPGPKRPTPAGSMAAVLVVTELGRGEIANRIHEKGRFNG